MGEQDWCLEGLNYSIWGKTLMSSGSSREGNMMSVGVKAPGSREALSSRAGCSSVRGSLCCSWGQSKRPAPIWPAQIHPSLINAAPTQPLCGTGRLRNALCLVNVGAKGLLAVGAESKRTWPGLLGSKNCFDLSSILFVYSQRAPGISLWALPSLFSIQLWNTKHFFIPGQ